MHYVQEKITFIAWLPRISANLNENYRPYNFQALELSGTRRSADDRYYYETPAFDSAHAECSQVNFETYKMKVPI